jgi:hypothetical protein
MNKLFPPNNEPHGVYKIYHREGNNYEHVANATVGNMLAAMVLPNLMPGAVGTELVNNLGMKRPTEFGDVIVNPDGQAHEIARDHLGEFFKAIDFKLNHQLEVNREPPEQEMEL